MASANEILASLAVKITGQTQEFEEAIKRSTAVLKGFAGTVNNDLKRSYEESDKLNRKFAQGFGRLADTFQSVGKTLSISVTAPLVALGGASLTAFGKMDRLQKGLTAVMGSAKAAEKEFKALEQVAKLPSIDLENAVKGSINLQTIGFSAEKARQTLEVFGNAVATIGKGTPEFERAIYGISQLANTDFPLGEDLNILKDAIPQVTPLLKEAFGTARSEDLRKLGVTSQQIVDTLLAGLGRLPKVTGGVANSFENLRNTSTASLAKIGESLNKNFDVEGKIGAIEKAIESLAQGFVSLSPSAQTTITVLAGVAAATGPLLYGIGAVTKAIPTLVLGLNTLKTTASTTFASLRTVAVPLAIIAGVLAASSVEDEGGVQQAADRTKQAAEAYKSNVDKFEKESTDRLKQLKEKLSKEFRNAQFDAFRSGSNTDQQAAKTLAASLSGQLSAIDKVLTERSIKLQEQGGGKGISPIDEDALKRAEKFRDELDKIYRQLAAAEEKGKLFADFDVPAEKINILKQGISGFLEDGIKPTNTEVEKLIGLLSQLNNQSIQKLRIDFGQDEIDSFQPIDLGIGKAAESLQPLEKGKQVLVDLAQAFAIAKDEAAAFGFENELAAEKQRIVGNAIQDIISNKFPGYEQVLEQLKKLYGELGAQAEETASKFTVSLAPFATLAAETLANFTQGLVEGGKALEGFGAKLLGAVGDLLVQLGTAAIAKAAAEIAIASLGPAAAIAAGTAAIALGGALKGASNNSLGKLKSGSNAPAPVIKSGLSGSVNSSLKTQEVKVNAQTTSIGSTIETLFITGKLSIAEENGALVGYINKSQGKSGKTAGTTSNG